MSGHLVRGHWLIGGIKFLRTQHSPEVNERLLGSLSKSLRSQLADIQPVQWYDREHHVDMLNAIASAHREEAPAQASLLAYGQLVAADLSVGPFRALFGILTPRLLVRKLPSLWHNDHQMDGALEVDLAQVDDGRLALKLTGLGGYPHVGVVAVGWVRGFMTACGIKDVVVRQTGWSLSQTAPSELTCEVRWS
jgi:hypothetical protein